MPVLIIDRIESSKLEKNTPHRYRNRNRTGTGPVRSVVVVVRWWVVVGGGGGRWFRSIQYIYENFSARMRIGPFAPYWPRRPLCGIFHHSFSIPFNQGLHHHHQLQHAQLVTDRKNEI